MPNLLQKYINLIVETTNFQEVSLENVSVAFDYLMEHPNESVVIANVEMNFVQQKFVNNIREENIHLQYLYPTKEKFAFDIPDTIKWINIKQKTNKKADPNDEDTNSNDVLSKFGYFHSFKNVDELMEHIFKQIEHISNSIEFANSLENLLEDYSHIGFRRSLNNLDTNFRFENEERGENIQIQFDNTNKTIWMADEFEQDMTHIEYLNEEGYFREPLFLMYFIRNFVERHLPKV